MVRLGRYLRSSLWIVSQSLSIRQLARSSALPARPVLSITSSRCAVAGVFDRVLRDLGPPDPWSYTLRSMHGVPSGVLARMGGSHHS